MAVDLYNILTLLLQKPVTDTMQSSHTRAKLASTYPLADSILAARIARASIVREGDSPPPELGKTLASTTNRLRQR